MKKRGFEIIEEYKDKGINMSVRSTRFAAAYDVQAQKMLLYHHLN